MNHEGNHQHYIGFTTTEGWLNYIDHDRPVHAAPVHERHDAGHGLVLCVHAILLAQIDGIGNVLYCRVTVDRYDSQDGVSPLFHGERHRHMTESAWAETQAWLQDVGLRAWHSVVAMPKDLRYLDGDAG